MDRETGYIYNEQRYLCTDAGIWLSVDPLVDKYLNISPYAYCNNNPLKYIDPDGREIVVIGDDGVATTYTPNSMYEGNDEYTSQMFAAFNNMASIDNGETVLSRLSNSSSRYIVQNGKSSIQGTYETSQNAQGATVNLDIASSLEQIAHELFHCFQIDMGQPIKTINSEVEAYIYAYGIAMTSFLNQGSEMSPMPPLSGMERGSSSYNDAVDALLWSTQFDSNLFQIVVSGFLQNSNANLYGVYDGYPKPSTNCNNISLIKNMYPIIK